MASKALEVAVMAAALLATKVAEASGEAAKTAA